MTVEKKASVPRTPAHYEGERPPCHGIPGLVCPRDDAGNIEPQSECVACPDVKTCLRKALEAEGLVKVVDPPSSVSKVSDFLRRWSHRKLTLKR